MKTAFAYLSVTLISIASLAESAGTLHLKDLIEEALQNRPAILAAHHEALSKQAEIGPKGSYDDPMLGIGLLNYPSDTLSPGELGMTGNEFSLTQKIPFPGKLSKLQNATRHEADSKFANFEEKKLDLIKEVQSNYFALFLAIKKKEILNEQLSWLSQLIQVTRSKYSLGRVQQAELLALQAEEGNLRDQLLTLEKEITVKSGDLNRSVGRESSSLLLRPELPPTPQLDFTQLTEESLSQKINEKNPSLKAAKFELFASESRLSYAKWSYLPDFEFKAAYMTRQASPGDRGVALLSGSVALSLPIWALTKQSEEVKSAANERTRYERLADEESLHLRHQVHTLLAELKESSDRVNLFEGGLVPLSKQAVLSAKSGYLTGKVDYATLVSLIRNRYQTEFSYHEALVNYHLKLAEYEALIGEPVRTKP